VKFPIGFVFGAIVGAGIALLIAPRDTKLPESVADLMDRGKAILEDARSNVDQAVSEGRRAADDQRRNLEAQTTS